MGCFSVFFPKTCTQKAIWDKTICDVANLFIVFEAIPSIVITLEPTTRLRQKSAPLFSVTFLFSFPDYATVRFPFSVSFSVSSPLFSAFSCCRPFVVGCCRPWVMGCCRHKKRTSDRLKNEPIQGSLYFSFRIKFFAPRTLIHIAPRHIVKPCNAIIRLQLPMCKAFMYILIQKAEKAEGKWILHIRISCFMYNNSLGHQVPGYHFIQYSITQIGIC